MIFIRTNLESEEEEMEEMYIRRNVYL